MYDVVIVGAGPAGLNAALWLGRCRRRVLLLDAGGPRNERSRWVSGFLTRDGTEPMELRRLGREELRRYPTVEAREAEAVGARRLPDGAFEVTLRGGERLQGRKLVLATGLMNDVPDLPDARRFFGRGVYPCPYCDGFEHGDEPILAYAKAGEDGRGMAVELLTWSRDVTLLTDGPSGLDEAERAELDRLGVPVVEEPLVALLGDPEGEGLEGARFASGRVLTARGLFYAFDRCRQSPLVEELGCDISEKGAVATGACEKTDVPGLFVAGDASKRVKFAVVAAAEGAMAAFAINAELLREDLARAADGAAAA